MKVLQRIIHGKEINFVTPDEIVKLIPRPEQKTRIRGLPVVLGAAFGLAVPALLRVVPPLPDMRLSSSSGSPSVRSISVIEVTATTRPLLIHPLTVIVTLIIIIIITRQ